MRRTFALLALAAAWGGPAAPAQTPREAPPNRITLRPALAAVPALKYRLVPERRSLVPGNAAIFYHRAIQFTIETRTRLAAAEKETAQRKREMEGKNDDSERRTPSVDERVAGWGTCPITEIPRDEARKLLEPFRSALKEVELGATRATCDWEFDQRHEGIEMLLPEIQEMRSLARLVTLQARLAVLDGKTDEAFHWIETGMVMGRQVSQGPTVIQALVGVAIDFVMARGLEDLIQAPGTPSLYWALADRPRPFVDMRYPLEGERYTLEKELPELADLDRGVWSLDEARRFADTLQRKLHTFTSGTPIAGTDGAVPTDIPAVGRRLGIAAMASKIYPEARRALIAQGRSQAQVDAMPVVQVAALHTVQEYQRRRDDAYKWMNLPYWQSYDRSDKALTRDVNDQLANPLLTLFQLLNPALNSARLAGLRLDRQLDALQCVEAVRIYADAHGGALPPSLEAITEAPPPIDPLTGKPFLYTLDGGSATLSAPVPQGAPNHPSFALRYVLTPAR